MSEAKPIGNETPNTAPTTSALPPHASGETSQAALDPRTALEADKTATTGTGDLLTDTSLASGAVEEGAVQQTRDDIRSDEPRLLPDKLELPATALKSASTGAISSSDDHMKRKREREGSLEPSASQTGLSTPDAVPTKKNRLLPQEEVDEEETPGKAAGSTAAATSATGTRNSIDGAEGDAQGVRQIRKRVQDLDWQENHAKRQSTEESVFATKEPEGEQIAAEGSGNKAGEGTASLKTQPTFASFSNSAKASKSTSPEVSGTPSSPRTQPTFASFTASTSSSPFVTGASGSRSWLSAASASASALGGLKPSALGSSLGSHTPGGGASGAASPASSAPSPPTGLNSSVADKGATLPAKGKTVASSASLGFGAFASGSGFSAATRANSGSPLLRASEPQESGSNHKEVGEEADGSESVFSRQLSEGGDRGLDQKEKVKLAATADALKTGEEDEETIFSSRAKLYTTSEAGWKERGTGTLRCNVPKKGTTRGGRLVMRTDGVLRVVLNVNLFAGMSCEVAQEKFIKLVALEDGKPVHFAIKFGNSSLASGLKEAVTNHMPR